MDFLKKFNVQFSTSLSIIPIEKELKPSKVSYFLICSLGFPSEFCICSLSVCLYKLLGATAVAERALAGIGFDNRYTGQNEMYRC